MDREDAFERIVALLNESMLDDDHWPAASALIHEIIGASGGVLMLVDGHSAGTFKILFSKACYRGVDRSAWLLEYFRDYHAEDEFLPRIGALPDGEVVRLADLFSEPELKTLRMVNEGLARFGGQDGLVLRLDGPGGSHIVWGIAPFAGADGWSSSQIGMIRRVVPHIRQYVRVRSALVDAESLGSSIIALLGAARTGVIQLDPRGRVVAANDRASDVLREACWLCGPGGALRAATTEDDATLQNLLARALPRSGGRGANGWMTVRRPGMRSRLVLHVAPVADREADRRSRQVAAVVLVVDPLAQARIDPGMVEAVLGLSPAETEVAVLLAEGRTARQIAAATGRGYNTVRTHLAHIFAKLGASRQLDVAQLVNALASLPASDLMGSAPSHKKIADHHADA